MRLSSTLVLVLVFCLAAQAALITSKSDPALSGATVIDFEAAPLGPFTLLTVNGVVFSPMPVGARGYISADYSGSYGATGRSLQNTYAPDAFGVLRILFPSPVSAFAFNWGASDTQWSLTAYDSSDNLIETVYLPVTSSSNDGYAGIKAGSALISRAVLSGSAGDYIFIDDFKFAGAGESAIPEPGTLVFAGIGLSAILLARLRARRS